MSKWPLFDHVQTTKINDPDNEKKLRIIEIFQYSLFKTNAHLNKIFLTGTSY